MKITKCEIQKRNGEKVSIFVDDKYSFSMTLNSFIEMRIKVGDVITEDKISEIKTKDGPNLAFVQILMTLGYGEKTEHQMIKKLKEKGFDENAINKSIAKAKELNYINDERYAEEYITKVAIPKKMGKQKIYTNLYQRGIEKGIIQNKIEEFYNEEDATDYIYEIAVQKCNSLKAKGNEPRQIQQKIYQFLLSKGYSYDISSQVVRELQDNNIF